MKPRLREEEEEEEAITVQLLDERPVDREEDTEF